MRISDWSSDVCSSDLLVATPAQVPDDDLFARHLRRQLADVRQRVRRLQRRDDSLYARAQLEGVQRLSVGGRDVLGAADVVQPGMLRPASGIVRLEASRAGRESVSKYGTWGSPDI